MKGTTELTLDLTALEAPGRKLPSPLSSRHIPAKEVRGKPNGRLEMQLGLLEHS